MQHFALLDGLVRVFDVPETDETRSPGSARLVVHRNACISKRAKRTETG